MLGTFNFKYFSSLRLYQVWFKNRRAKYRKETKRYLSPDNHENEEEETIVCHAPQIQEPSPCFQCNTTAMPYYCNYSDILEPALRHRGLPSEMHTQFPTYHGQLAHSNGYHSLLCPNNHGVNHVHFGHTWTG